MPRKKTVKRRPKTLRDLLLQLDDTERDELAERCGVKTRYLQFIAYHKGDKRPSAETAIRIHAATKGLVTAKSLRPDLPWDALR